MAAHYNKILFQPCTIAKIKGMTALQSLLRHQEMQKMTLSIFYGWHSKKMVVCNEASVRVRKCIYGAILPNLQRNPCKNYSYCIVSTRQLNSHRYFAIIHMRNEQATVPTTLHLHDFPLPCSQTIKQSFVSPQKMLIYPFKRKMIHINLILGMDINDFKDNFKYKLIIPFIYILNWALMFVGPTFIQVQYQKICIVALTYLCLKSTVMLFIAVIAFFKTHALINRAIDFKEEVYVENQLQHDILHAFIIPSYREDIELLSETLDQLASHPWAKARIMIFLAMQAHEEHSQLKAEQLIQMYRGKFRLMGYTQHHLREFEQKGKAANVSWCAEHLQEVFFKPLGINADNVFLSIIDADTWVPPIYLKEVEDHLTNEKNYERRHTFIYAPNQIFTRNHLDVPIVTRTFDQLHSCLHHSNMLSVFNCGFPLSNYTLSFSLIKRTGFWDTCPDAIGEDFHTTIKAYWKCPDNVETVCIYACLNQVNIQTGKGYLADIEARFWQAERHARGVADVAYQINMLVKQPFNFKAFILAYQTIETFVLPGIVPWAIMAMTYQSKILFHYTKSSPLLISQDYMSYFFNYATFCFYFTYFLYFFVKRRANSVLYGQQNESILRIIEYPLLFLLNMIFISIPTFVIAGFGVLFEGREYVVADKVISRKNIEETH